MPQLPSCPSCVPPLPTTAHSPPPSGLRLWYACPDPLWTVCNARKTSATPTQTGSLCLPCPHLRPPPDASPSYLLPSFPPFPFVPPSLPSRPSFLPYPLSSFNSLPPPPFLPSFDVLSSFSIRTSASLHPPSYPFYLLSSLPALTSYPSSLPSLASSVPSLINFLPSVSFPLAISFPFFLRSFPQSPSLPPSFLPSRPTSTLLPSFLPSVFFHSAVPSFTQHPSLLTPFSQVSGEAAGIVAQPKQR